mmetsp:Transcript_10784/g.10410  ORF Transcript_10784/g.10410 Transcript_10784/m.10410 type:complete len:642 (+) Transcript_10784:246-2171(+)
MTKNAMGSISIPNSPSSNSRRPDTSDTQGTSGGFSTSSAMKRKKKKEQPVYSLEDLFGQVSSANTSNLNAPPGKIVLTPRSAEACLKLGVNPEILKVRDIDSFWEPGGIEPVVQRMRHEAYVQRRHDTMKQCRLERKRITNAMFDESGAVDASGEQAMTQEVLLQSQKAQSSTLIQLEMQKIAKMQARQEKELGQMIQFEIARVKIQEEMNQRMEVQKRREDQAKRQTEKRSRLAAEERRLKEMQKSAIGEVEEENRRALARQMHERDKMIEDQRARKEVQARRRAAEEEMDRSRKAEEHKAQVQKYFADEQLRLRERMETMNFAEKKKNDQIIKKQKEHAHTMRAKREKIEKRIELNMSMAEEIEEKRKNEFLDKQEHFERLRVAHLQQLEQDRILHSQEIALQEQRRHMIMIQQRKEEERASERLIGKFEEDEEHVVAVQEMRDREHGLHRERKSLRVQMKLENVERVMRQGEYKKSVTLKKIEDQDGRIKSMLSLRQQLTNERRNAAAAIRIQKENVTKVMEEVRCNASKANKMINAAMSGKMPLQAITNGEPGRGGTSSIKKKKGLNKLKRSQSVTDMIALGPPHRSKSAGEDPDYSLDDEFENSTDKGRSPFLTAEQAAEIEPLPYISPYEMPTIQ